MKINNGNHQIPLDVFALVPRKQSTPKEAKLIEDDDEPTSRNCNQGSSKTTK